METLTSALKRKPVLEDVEWCCGLALTKAAGGGQLPIVQYLIEKGVRINYANDQGATALLEAARGGHLSVVDYLVVYKANPHQSNKEGLTALMLASSNGRISVVEYLVKLGAVIDQVDLNGESAFMKASFNGHLEVAKYLADQGASMNAVHECLQMAAKNGHLAVVEWLAERERKSLEAALLNSAQNGHLEVMTHLLASMSLDDNTEYLLQSLTLASKQGHTNVVKFLLDRMGARTVEPFVDLEALEGAARFGSYATVECLVDYIGKCSEEYATPVLKKDYWRVSVAREGAQAGHLDIVKIALGAEPSQEALAEILVTAAGSGQYEMVEYILAIWGSSFSTPNKQGDTALMMAAQRGHLEMIKLLKRVSELPKNKWLAWRSSAANFVGETALMKAAGNGHLEVVAYLCENLGSVIDARDKNGETAIMKAARNGHLEVVQYLMDKPGGSSALTTLGKAAENGLLSTVKYLVAAGADPNFVADDTSPLIEAASYGHLPVVQYLVEKGAVVNWQNTYGTTALVAAASTGHKSVVEFLVDCDADINAFGTIAIAEAAADGHLDLMEYLTDKLLALKSGSPCERAEEVPAHEASTDGQFETINLPETMELLKRQLVSIEHELMSLRDSLVDNKLLMVTP